MILPFTGVTHLASFIMIYVCYLKLNKNYKEMSVKDETLKSFLFFTLYMSIFQLLMALGHIPVLFNAMNLFYYTFNFGYIVGHLFLYFAQAHIILVPFNIYFIQNKYKKLGIIYSKFLLVFGVIITVVNIFYPTNPTIDMKTGLTIFNVPSIVAALIPVIVLLASGIAGVMFLYMAGKVHGSARAKAILLGITMFLIITGGPLHETATSVAQYFMADVLVVFAFFVMMIGIYYEQIIAKLRKEKVAQ